MAQYTVRQATPTGKVDNTYGAEYIVNFNEDQREVKLSRKQPVMAGQVENGTIVDGKYGAYFKKDPFVPGGQPSQVATPSTPAALSTFKKTDNSDGMRQGMCINNASSFVAAQHPADPARMPLSPAEWADAVHSYASALYAKGDLIAPEVTNVFAQ